MSETPSFDPLAALTALAFGEDGISLEDLAGQLREVIRGEDVCTVYDADGDVVSRKVSSTVRSKGRGLLIADRLAGGALGLSRGKVGGLLEDKTNDNPYAQFAGPVDDRLVRRKAVDGE